MSRAQQCAQAEEADDEDDGAASPSYAIASSFGEFTGVGITSCVRAVGMTVSANCWWR